MQAAVEGGGVSGFGFGDFDEQLIDILKWLITFLVIVV